MTDHTPTDEQQACRRAFMRGSGLVIEAGAGTGKTSTLKMLAATKPNSRGIYIAYNRAIADDAKKSFPATVKCSTAHGLAFGSTGRQFAHRLRGSRVTAMQTAQILGIKGPVTVGQFILAPQQMARLTMEMVKRFCKSADQEFGLWHTPRKPGLDDPATLAALAAELLPLARKAWDDLTYRDGRLKYEHDHYLKLWQMSGPRLGADYVLFDEAQDANPVTLSVVTQQTDSQLVAVGDRSQAIYGWNGSIDSMTKFPADERLTLSQSFRFGSQVAREANKWLEILGADLRLTGYDRISSRLGTLDAADAILCRTNAEAMVQAMTAMNAGKRAAIVGGGREIKALAEAAITLKAGAGCSHPELIAFRTWGDVQDHAENDPSGADLLPLVRLIDSHGPDAIIDMVDRLSDEDRADAVISTSHKSKGREWNSVRIASDFREPKRDPEHAEETPVVPDDLAMLAYVSVTRAKLALDREGLAWVDHYLPQAATPQAVTA